MALAELAQLLAILGSIVGLLSVGWKISRALTRLIDRVASVDHTVRRVEIRMRTMSRRLDRLEDDRKGMPDGQW